jgi:lysozyme family protein
MNLHYGRDDVNDRDLRKLSTASVRDRSDWAFANLMYKLNNFVTFGYEQSYYSTISDRSAAGTFTTLFRGQGSRSWHDVREEFSTIFTF